jgi:hypothetical protein
MPSLLPQFAEAFGCKLQNISESREMGDYVLKGDCASPFASNGIVNTTELSLSGVFAELRKLGVTQVFLTWDHPGAALSELTPAAYEHWEQDNRAYEERSFYIDAPIPKLKLIYGAPETHALLLPAWSWLGLMFAIALSAFASSCRGTAIQSMGARVLVLESLLLTGVWTLWTVAVVVSQTYEPLTQIFAIPVFGACAALVVLCIPPIFTYTICFVLLGGFHRYAGANTSRLGDAKLGFALASRRAIWNVVMIVWFSGSDPVSQMTVCITVFLVFPIERLLRVAVMRAAGLSGTTAAPGPLVERANELAIQAKARIKGIRIMAAARPGCIMALGSSDGYIYLPEIALRTLSKSEMDASLIRVILALRGRKMGLFLAFINSCLLFSAFAVASQDRIRMCLIFAVGACAWIATNRLRLRGVYLMDTRTAEFTGDPSATVRAAEKWATINGLPQNWGGLMAIALYAPAPAKRARALVGLLGAAKETEHVTYEVPPLTREAASVPM